MKHLSKTGKNCSNDPGNPSVCRPGRNDLRGRARMGLPHLKPMKLYGVVFTTLYAEE